MTRVGLSFKPWSTTSGSPGPRFFLYQPAEKAFICTACSGGFNDFSNYRCAEDEDEMNAFRQILDTGQMMAYLDTQKKIKIGPYILSRWIALGIKGREAIHGVVLIDPSEEGLCDAVSIIINFFWRVIGQYKKKVDRI